MQSGSKLLRLLITLLIGPTSLNEGEGLLPGRRVWLEVKSGHVTNFYIWYLRTCPKCPPAHNGFLYKGRFQVDIRGFSIE